MKNSYRNHLMSASRIQIPQDDGSSEIASDFTRLAQAAVSPVETVLHQSFAAAHAALRQNRLRGKADPRTIGKRGEYRSKHIAYAFEPARRKVGKDWVYGMPCVWVLHATKGWKILHGAS